jgi:hypothetical protein
MKRIVQAMLLLSLLYSCKKHNSFFRETPSAYRDNTNHINTTTLNSIKKYDEGYYTFDICLKDTLMYDERIQWFCDCDDPESLDTIESLCILFVDDARAYYFKNPASSKHSLDLDKKRHKLAKLGVYTIKPTHHDGTEIFLRVRDKKVQNSMIEFSDLFLQVTDEGNLVLRRMLYHDLDNSIARLVRSNKKHKSANAIDGVSIDLDNLREIKPEDVFSIAKIEYKFHAQPFTLYFDGKPVEKIEYNCNGNGADCQRMTTLQSKTILTEMLLDSLTIKTW